jgi:hypothetical protein
VDGDVLVTICGAVCPVASAVIAPLFAAILPVPGKDDACWVVKAPLEPQAVQARLPASIPATQNAGALDAANNSWQFIKPPLNRFEIVLYNTNSM